MYGQSNLDNLNLNLYIKNSSEEDLTNLQKIESRIEDLKYFLVQEKNRFQTPNTPKVIQKDIDNTIKILEKQIEKLEKEGTRIIVSNKDLKIKYEILISQKGIGEITAKILITFLPELGQKEINRESISATYQELFLYLETAEL